MKYYKTALVEAFDTSNWPLREGEPDITHFPIWMVLAMADRLIEVVGNKIRVKTLEGWVESERGCFICSGQAGEIWPVKREIFLATHKEFKVVENQLADFLYELNVEDDEKDEAFRKLLSIIGAQ